MLALYRHESLIKSIFIRYAVSIAAFNNAGTGPFSISIFQDTREGGKITETLQLASRNC